MRFIVFLTQSPAAAFHAAGEMTDTYNGMNHYIVGVIRRTLGSGSYNGMNYYIVGVIRRTLGSGSYNGMNHYIVGVIRQTLGSGSIRN